MAKTAWVDLSKTTIQIEDTDEELLSSYIGSRGIAAKVLYDLAGPEIGPLDPENPLIFSTGPFTGTPWPSAARYTVTAKSPATGAYGYANSSGFFGPQMRKAGYDMFIIRGKAEKPVYLLVEDEGITVHSAEHLWGKETGEVEDYLRKQYEGAKVAGIGPAGENLVQIASVINDYGRAAARTGMGAVMGSKNLKAVVVKGSAKQSLPDEFKKVIKRVGPLVRNHPGVLSHMAGMFTRRAYNIESIAAGVTENPDVTRITIVVSGDEIILEQVTKQLNKLVDVVKVYDLTKEKFVDRELVLVKVMMTPKNRSAVIELTSLFHARVAIADNKALTIQMVGSKDEVDSFLELVKPNGILDISRTGVIAVGKSDDA